jgi:histidyl-tRNA synthetase
MYGQSRPSRPVKASNKKVRDVSKLQPVRGTQDVWGEDARRCSWVVDVFRSVALRYGFGEIQTPIFEFTEVFARTLGETSDVVSKEMYSFTDRGGDSLTLRPENTAGIARAYLSEGMKQHGVSKLFGWGPMFRYERPQKGRYRQFNQLDAEIIGAAEPAADIEIIALGYQLLLELGLGQKVRLELNTLGDMESRADYRAALVKYFNAHKDKLSKDSLVRLEKNPLRILDSKAECDRALMAEAPVYSNFLNVASKSFFERVQVGLTALDIPYEINQRLVRGLDYYCHTSFEFITTGLGAQGTVIGGGRYDGLIEQMGGAPTPGVGWAGGVERLAMLMGELPAPARPVSVITLGEAADILGAVAAYYLRQSGKSVDMAFKGNLKKRLQRANKINASHAIIIGDDEISKNIALIRDLDSGEQREVAIENVVESLIPES